MEIAEVSRCIYASDEGVQLDEGVRSREKKAFAVQMYMNNVGGRKVGFLLGVSHWLVLK